MPDQPRIVAICLTMNRPRLLAQAIRMFQLQSYPNREMLVYDYTGQYETTTLDGNVRIVSQRLSFPSMGTARNLAVRMTDAPYIAVWDDDDLYYPWHLAACAHALEKHAWALPSQVWDQFTPADLILTETFGRHSRTSIAYHGSWSYTRNAFERVGGYPEHAPDDKDIEYSWKLADVYGVPGDTICPEFPAASYLYSRSRSPAWHASELGDAALRAKQSEAVPYVGKITPAWPEGYLLGLPANPVCVPRRW